MARNGLFPKSVQPGIPRLGKLPKGWQSFLLGDLVKEVSRPASLVDDKEYLQVTAKRSRGGIVSRGSQRGKKIKTKTQFYVEPGDFLISRRQIVHGGCGIVPDALNGAIVSNEYLVLHSNGKILQDYLQWLSHSIYFQQTCFHASIGVHVEKMVFKPEWWFKFKFQIPPVEEQKRIAEILNTWDTAITQTEQLIAAKQKLKKGLMQQLLTGKKRFSEFANEWHGSKLGDLFKERNESNGHGLPLLSVTGEFGIIPHSESGRKDSSSDDKSKYKRVAPGDIAYNTMRMWQGVSALSSLEGIVSPAYTIVIPKSNMYGPFVAHFFKYPAVIHLFHRYSQGLVSDTLNLKFYNFAQIKVRVSSHEEQKKIAATLDTISSEITALKRLMQKLKEQKRGLMQKLLTGQVRVKA